MYHSSANLRASESIHLVFSTFNTRVPAAAISSKARGGHVYGACTEIGQRRLDADALSCDQRSALGRINYIPIMPSPRGIRYYM